ncbi:zinc finger protein 664-like [Melanotaenia boesemani]|uniref:zinc finger protein 664-like n=1 Tax=Melanotaenia boesemani TaxID=1250792 RepID=UPI001C056F2F|nr:zinc finger protein 664-like [Melanotaenia boesemani]XP_041829672.1 zinc finger protein 664-like [Melanotaenia boesemani]XP_041829673.1 zinc finger protein 664-like [Melanotaenia boesemani]XP_041829674.1 zinc finger protein 664-like [Melanotaenia boesemani]
MLQSWNPKPENRRWLGLVSPKLPAATPELEEKDLDVQQLVIKEEDPWSLNQQNPETRHIKEEKEELWPGGQEETDISRFSFTAVTVKSEVDEEQPRSSQLHQIKTEDSRETEPPTSMKLEPDEEDWGGPESDRKSDPSSYLQQNINEKVCENEVSIDDSQSDDDWRDPLSDSGPETDDPDWTESRDPELAVNTDATKKVLTGGKAFNCGLCGKTFTRLQGLKMHSLIHTEEKPFACSLCSQTFKHRSTMQRHMKIHTGVKPFSCEVCSKTFSQQAILQRHKRLHTGEKPFTCSLCGKTFLQKTHLKRHTRTHTGEKPFRCSVCAKGFKEMTHLKRHTEVHTRQKAFQCHECGKTYNRQGNLQKHARVHSRDAAFGSALWGEDLVRQFQGWFGDCL